MALGGSKNRVTPSLEAVQRVVDGSRRVVDLRDADHTYEEKFEAAEISLDLGIAATLNALPNFSEDACRTVLKWVHEDKARVRLALRFDQLCSYKGSERKTIQSPTEREISIFGINISFSSSHTVDVHSFDLSRRTTVTLVRAGASDDGHSITLYEESTLSVVVNSSRNIPPGAKPTSFSKNVDMTELFARVSESQTSDPSKKIAPTSTPSKEEASPSTATTSSFRPPVFLCGSSIDRTSPKTRTPANNGECATIVAALQAVSAAMDSFTVTLRDTGTAAEFRTEPVTPGVGKSVRVPEIGSFVMPILAAVDEVAGTAPEYAALQGGAEGTVSSATPTTQDNASGAPGASDIAGVEADVQVGGSVSPQAGSVVQPGTTVAASSAGGDVTVGGAVVVGVRQGTTTRSLRQHGAALVADMVRKMLAECARVGALYGDSASSVVSKGAVGLMVRGVVMQTVSSAVRSVVEGLDLQLREQVLAALGGHLTSSDVRAYVRWLMREFFDGVAGPHGLAGAVRGEGEAPAATFEVRDADGVVDVFTGVYDGEHAKSDAVGKHAWGQGAVDGKVGAGSGVAASAPFSIRFPISSVVDVVVGGPTHVHGYVSCAFGNSARALASAQTAVAKLDLSLTVVARPDTGVVVVLGRAGPDGTLRVDSAFYCRDKDEWKVPLSAVVSSTTEDVRLLLEALSPAQRAFAMKLRAFAQSSGALVMCILQTRPQLEKILNIQHGGLIRETALVDALMRLLVEQGFPPDSLAYDGDGGAPAVDRVKVVGERVDALQAMIRRQQRREVAELKLQAKVAKYNEAAGVVDPPKGDTIGRLIEKGVVVGRREPPQAASGVVSAAVSGQRVAGGAGAKADAYDALSPAEIAVAANVDAAKRVATVRGGPVGFAAMGVKVSGAETLTRQRVDPLTASTSHDSLSSLEAKQEAYCVLDALTLSGLVPFDAASSETHVFVAAVAAYADTLVDVVAGNNVDPTMTFIEMGAAVATAVNPRASKDILAGVAKARAKVGAGRSVV